MKTVETDPVTAAVLLLLRTNGGAWPRSHVQLLPAPYGSALVVTVGRQVVKVDTKLLETMNK